MKQTEQIINRGNIKYKSVVTYINGTVTKVLTQIDRNTKKVIRVDSESVLEEDFLRGHFWKYQIPIN